MNDKLWWNCEKIKKGKNFGKNVKLMTSFDDVTIVLKQFEYAQRIALAPSFNLIYGLLWSVVVYSRYNETIKKRINGNNLEKSKFWKTKQKCNSIETIPDLPVQMSAL